MARDFRTYKDPLTGKTRLSLSNNDLETVDGIEEASQRVETALTTIKGEYAFDLEKGLPLFDQIFRRKQFTNLVLSYYRNALLAVNGITSINTLEIERINVDREYKITFSAVFQNNQTITGTI